MYRSLVVLLILLLYSKRAHSGRNCTSLKAVPNVESLLFGYNFFEFASQKASGAREQIFQLTDDNQQVHESIGWFPHGRCNMKAIEQTATSSREYRNAILNSILAGNSFQLGQQADVSLGVEAGVKAEVSTTVEPFATSASDNSEASRSQDAFYRFEKGQSAIIIAICYSYEVTMNQLQKPKFHPNFARGVQQLYHSLFRNTSDAQALLAFKNFIKSFGTHYARKQWLGRTARYERHFAHEEIRDLTEKEIVECGKKFSKISIFGAGAVGASNNTCKNNAGASDRLRSDYVTREHFSTTGAPLTRDMDAFSQTDMLPVVVKADLIPLLDLFTPTNMETILMPEADLNAFRQKLIPFFWNISNIMGYSIFDPQSCNCSSEYSCVQGQDGHECKRLIRLFWKRQQTASSYEIKVFGTDGKRQITTHASQCRERFCTHQLLMQDPDQSLTYEISPKFNDAVRDTQLPKGQHKWNPRTQVRSLTFQRHPEAKAYWITVVHPATQHVFVTHMTQCPHDIKSLEDYLTFSKSYYHGLRCRIDIEMIPRIDYLIYVKPIIDNEPHLALCGTYNYGVRSYFLEKFMFDST